jgi:hypothetical protein
VISLILIACTAYAYFFNAHRSADDPKKKDYEFGAIFIAPIIFPFLFTFAIAVFIFRALLFAAYLIALTIAMVVRKPFILAWLQKLALKIGEPLLKMNTELFRLAFGNSRSI